MKTLYLARHAKSSWDESGLPDHQRPLMQTGEQKTMLVAAYLKKEGAKPDLIIASHAVRARETAKIIAGDLGYPEKDIMIEKVVYDGPYEKILDLVYSTPNKVDSLMLVGHNPLITETMNHFLNTFVDYMPTSAVVGMTFATTKWEEVPLVKAVKKFYIYPKLLR